MICQRIVFTMLVLSTRLADRTNMVAQGSTFQIPTHGYMVSGKTVYSFMGAHMTWNDAAKTCKKMYRTKGGSLAKVHSKNVMDLISNMIGAWDVWLGIHWSMSQSTNVYDLIWDDAFCSRASPSDYSAFLDNQGGLDQNNPCYFIQQGTWRRQGCSHQRKFVCQYQETSVDEMTDCGAGVPAFSPAQANVYHVAVSDVTDQTCQLKCAGILGCVFTLVHRERCMVGVIQQGNSSIYFRNSCYGTATVPDVSPLNSINSATTPGACFPLEEEDIVVTDTPITRDVRLGGVADPNNASTASSLESVKAATVTITLSVSEDMPVASLVVTEPCSDNTARMTPAIVTVTETLTLTQTVIASVAPPATLPPSPTPITKCPESVSAIPLVTTTATEYIHVTLTPSSCPLTSVTPCSMNDVTTTRTTAMDGGGAGGDSIVCVTGSAFPAPSVITQTVCLPPGTSQQALPSVSTSENQVSCPPPKNVTLNPSQLEQVTESIVQELTVPKKSLSQTRRKKESAPDKRTTAQTSGYLAIFCLSFTFGGVLLSDFPVFYNQIHELVGNTKP